MITCSGGGSNHVDIVPFYVEQDIVTVFFWSWTLCHCQYRDNSYLDSQIVKYETKLTS